jgi:two-component system OmpR family response regulator
MVRTFEGLNLVRILLAEDDEMIGRSLSDALRREAMVVDWVRDGNDAAEALAHAEHAIALIDVGLPGKSGFELIETTRRAGGHIPVIVLTARDGVNDRVTGLELGADDYLVKPFEVRELLARMRAVLRRHAGVTQSIFEAGALSLDLASHAMHYGDVSHVLPAREFALMRALMERPGAILSRAQLEERLYGWGEEVESNAIDALIYSVRRKFDKDIIRNVRGAGWMVLKEMK